MGWVGLRLGGVGWGGVAVRFREGLSLGKGWG